MEQQENMIQSKMEQKIPTIGSSQSARSSVGQTNDNSNPQQGTGAGGMTKAALPQSNHLPVAQDFKIPPTKKDARKLFVGGLPSDGTYTLHSVLRNQLVRYIVANFDFVSCSYRARVSYIFRTVWPRLGLCGDV